MLDEEIDKFCLLEKKKKKKKGTNILLRVVGLGDNVLLCWQKQRTKQITCYIFLY